MRSILTSMLPKSKFARGASILAGGTAGAQIVALLAAPVITRLYDAADFGLLAVFTAVLAVISIIATLSYELAIPLPEGEGDASSVAYLALVLVVCTAALSAGAALFLGEEIATLLNVPLLSSYIWLIPIGILLMGSYQTVSYWTLRHKNFGAVSGTRLTQSILMVVVQIAGSSLGAGALLIGQVAGQGVGSTSLVRVALRKGMVPRPQLRGMVHAAIRYRRFAVLSVMQSLFNTAGRQAPAILLAIFFGPAAAGLYALAFRVVVTPVNVISLAVGSVLHANGPEANRRGELSALIEKLYASLTQLGIPAALILLLAGPELFALVFGNNWREAGYLASILAPWSYIVFITTPISTLFIILEKQGQGAAFQTIVLAARSSSLLIGGLLHDLTLAISLYSAASVMCYAGFLIWAFHTLGIPLSHLLLPLVRSLLVGLVFATPLILVKLFDGGDFSFVAALVGTILAAAMYYLRLAREAY